MKGSKRALLFCCLFSCSALIIAQETVLYLDTMEVAIGEQAKLIFLAKEAKDFQHIDRYDLNYLFDELWEQRQSGDLATRELSRPEAELFREGRPQPSTMVVQSKQSYFINFFLGWSHGFSAS